MILELHATPEEVMRAVASLQEFCRDHRIPEPALFALTLALEECGSNIVNHALHGEAQQTFRVIFSYTGNAIVIELRDSGPPFDPTQAPAEEGRDVAEDRRSGGWGIQLVYRSIDEIYYRRAGKENVLRLTKRLDALKGKHSANPS
jgi:anti-sigma regulatory factor (Ser/Thr protein kinase)